MAPRGNPVVSTETHAERRGGGGDITMCGWAGRAGWHFNLDLPISRHRKEHGGRGRRKNTEKRTEKESAGYALNDHQLAKEWQKVAFGWNLRRHIKGVFSAASSSRSNRYFKQAWHSSNAFFFFSLHTIEVLQCFEIPWNKVISIPVDAQNITNNTTIEGSPEKGQQHSTALSEAQIYALYENTLLLQSCSNAPWNREDCLLYVENVSDAWPSDSGNRATWIS